jgi:hypothetical protein
MDDSRTYQPTARVGQQPDQIQRALVRKVDVVQKEGEGPDVGDGAEHGLDEALEARAEFLGGEGDAGWVEDEVEEGEDVAQLGCLVVQQRDVGELGAEAGSEQLHKRREVGVEGHQLAQDRREAGELRQAVPSVSPSVSHTLSIDRQKGKATHQASKRTRLALDHLRVPPEARAPPVGLVGEDERALPDARGPTDDHGARDGGALAALLRVWVMWVWVVRAGAPTAEARPCVWHHHGRLEDRRAGRVAQAASSVPGEGVGMAAERRRVYRRLLQRQQRWWWW